MESAGFELPIGNRLGERVREHEDSIIALSPDGSEVKVQVEPEGCLWDESGPPLMHPVRVFNISVGAEMASDYYGSDKWGANSNPVILWI